MQNLTEELIPSNPDALRLDAADKLISGGNFPDSDAGPDGYGIQEDLFHSRKHGYYLRRTDGRRRTYRAMSRADIMRWLVDRHTLTNMGIRKEFHALMDAAGIGGSRITTAR